MNFQEQDIDFEKIGWQQFEELCFDLLLKYQFYNIIWHQGSADNGRDIEATYSPVNALVGSYTEKWFFECKFYSGGIPMTEMVSKIGWATAHRVKHFVLITNTYPTKSTREYLDLTQESANFKIHIIDGKAIKQHLLSFPDIIVKYFADDTMIWVKNLLKQWVFQDMLPDLKTLFKLSKNVNPAKLDRTELVFLFMAFEASNYNEDFLEDEIEPFSFDFLKPEIKNQKNAAFPIEIEDETGLSGSAWSHFQFQSAKIKGTDIMHFAYQDHDTMDKLQMLLRRENKQVFCKISFRDDDTAE